MGIGSKPKHTLQYLRQLQSRFFIPLGKVKKIPEVKGKKTFDFRIDQSKILLEVTSLSTVLTSLPTTFNEELLVAKLQEAIGHMLEKDTPALPNFFRGGIIFCETVFNIMSRFYLKLNDKLPELIALSRSGLGFLVFAPQPASIDNMDSSNVFPIVFYVKEGPLYELFKRIFKDKNYKILVF